MKTRILLGLVIILLALLVSGCEAPTAPACAGVDTVGLAFEFELSRTCPTVLVITP